MPLADRNKRTQQWALAQLRLIAESPAAVLILNQSRNMHRPLAAFADIVIEMNVPRPHASHSLHGTGAGGEGTRRRNFTGAGRYPETLQSVVAELNPEGADYVFLPGSPVPHAPLLATLQTLLTESPTPLTCRELLSRWPGGAPRPDSLWRTLARGVERGIFVVSGAGTKTDAFRFGVVRQTTAADLAAEEQQDPGPT